MADSKRKNHPTEDTNTSAKKAKVRVQKLRTDQLGAFDHFSDEVILHILSFMEHTKDISHFGATAKRANRIANDALKEDYVLNQFYIRFGLDVGNFIQQYGYKSELYAFLKSHGAQKTALLNEWDKACELPSDFLTLETSSREELEKICGDIEENKYPIDPIKLYLKMKLPKANMAFDMQKFNRNIINLYRATISSNNVLNYHALYLSAVKIYQKQLEKPIYTHIRNQALNILSVIDTYMNKKLQECTIHLPEASKFYHPLHLVDRLINILSYTVYKTHKLPLQASMSALDATLRMEHFRGNKEFYLNQIFDPRDTPFGRTLALEKMLSHHFKKNLFRKHFPQLTGSGFYSLYQDAKFPYGDYNYLRFLCDKTALIPIIRDAISLDIVSEENLCDEIKSTMDNYFPILTLIPTNELTVLVYKLGYTFKELLAFFDQPLLLDFIRNLTPHTDWAIKVRDEYRTYGIPNLEELIITFNTRNVSKFESLIQSFKVSAQTQQPVTTYNTPLLQHSVFTLSQKQASITLPPEITPIPFNDEDQVAAPVTPLPSVIRQGLFALPQEMPPSTGLISTRELSLTENDLDNWLKLG